MRSWMRFVAVACLVPSTAALRAQVTFEDTIFFTTPSAQLGDRITSGDVNGDGVLDLAVADTGYSFGSSTFEGRAWVFLGPSYATKITVVTNAAPWDFLGFRGGWDLVDINGDGLEDLLMGAPRSYAGTAQPWVGRVLVSFAPTFQTTIDLVHPDPTQAMSFGVSVVSHDYIKDGIPDIIVGSPQATVSAVKKGRLDVYSGATAWAQPSSVTFQDIGSTWPLQWGFCALVTDFDGNGSTDLLTSHRDKTVYPPGTDFVWFKGGDPSDRFTCGIYPATTLLPYYNLQFVDVNGDGKSDIVSADLQTFHDVVVSYGPQFTDEMILTEPTSDSSSDFGRGLGVGDVNRDGAIDLVIGAPEVDKGQDTTTGRVSIYFGPSFTQTQSFWGAHKKAEYGTGVHVVDLDEDGFAEIFVGAGLEFGGSLHLFKHHTLRILGNSTVSLAQGGSVTLSIETGPKGGSHDYLILASVSGSDPGLDVPYAGGFVHVPVNPDVLTSAAIALANTPVFSGFFGTTGTEGKAAATLAIPAGLGDPSLAGTRITLAAVLAKPGVGIDYATKAVSVFLAP